MARGEAGTKVYGEEKEPVPLRETGVGQMDKLLRGTFPEPLKSDGRTGPNGPKNFGGSSTLMPTLSPVQMRTFGELLPGVTPTVQKRIGDGAEFTKQEEKNHD